MKKPILNISLRKRNRPKLVYNNDLPIMARKADIITAIKKHRVVIISGETGSGKTTQIPKFCLAADRGINGQIGCTQPRRIAATTVARRIAEELGEELGQSVGYKIRFQDRVSAASYIKIMTDGILLAEAQQDPLLRGYDTIIVDEAHERSLNIDFVLGILKSLLKKRDDLKVIVTSATIDTEKFSRAFERAPVIEVSGRMYPVETRYEDAALADEESEAQTYVERAVQALDALQRKGPFGDVLIFMPTEQAIRETVELIAGRGYRGVTVLPLFARLKASEQKKVFANCAGRKIIVATNVAETSITIPGIRYVIDTGLARISQYSPRSRTTALPVAPISRSSADQRKGRCGRVSNGICIRLFSEQDYQARPLFTLPEILRANLAEVILRMIALKLGNVAEFPFIDPPAAQSIRDGFGLLQELGAIVRQPAKRKTRAQAAYELTRMGSIMAKMPVDPRLSRILIEAESEGCVEEVLVIVSALSIQDPRERPAEKIADADRAQAVFQDPQSDFITLLNIWKQYQTVIKDPKSMGSVGRFCKTHFLSFNRMREWRDIHDQIHATLKALKLHRPAGPEKEKPRPSRSAPADREERFGARYAAIHRSILSGYLSNIALKKEKNMFRAAKGRDAMIFPGSALFNRAGEWIVAAEMVETSRLFIRTVANIDSAWLEALGQALCRYTYLAPHWEKNRGEVVATEQVSLFGLIIVPGRPVGYGRINAEEANDIFIREALIGGDMRRPLSFMRHNLALIDTIKDMENRIRKRTLLVDENVLYAFYKQRLALIFDTRTLNALIKEKKNDEFLRMNQADLLANLPDGDELSLFPDALKIAGREYPFRYQFEPGAPDDGVTVEVSASLAAAVPTERLDWMVPGLLREKIITLIRGLPKKYRTRLVPVNTVADTIVAGIPRENTALATALSRFVFDTFGFSIPASAWPMERLPDHLRMRIAITGPRGEVLDAGRDKAILYHQATEHPGRKEFEALKQKWERTGITKWDVGDLPDCVTLTGRDGARWVCHVALTVEGDAEDSVGLRLFERPADAAAAHLPGVAALLGLRFSKELKFLQKALRLPPAKKVLADYFGGASRIEKRLLDQVKKDLFHRSIRTAKAFEEQAGVIEARLMDCGRKKLSGLLMVLEAYHDIRSTLYRLEKTNRARKNTLAFLAGLREDLTRLMPQNFLELYSQDRIDHLPRYLRTLAIRAERGCLDLEKDQQRTGQLSVYHRRLEAILKALSPLSTPEKRSRVEDFFWLLEEYKVSVFAQELKTTVPVSPKRLDAMLAEIDKMI